MNYQHIYHAGNFADIAKHVALLFCLEALKRKDAPFFALDTHAGRGIYDLQSAEAVKSGEAEQGIQKLLAEALDSAPLAPYFAALRARRGKRLALYPGSPALIAAALRPQDRAVFVELMPAEARAVEREIDSPGRMFAQVGDGYAMLKSQLPPAERRGLVLIDPPYEAADELKTLLKALAEAHRRWPTGTFLIWYPIKTAEQRASVHARFQALRIPKMLAADLTMRRDDVGVGLVGSGLIVVNPPFGSDEFLTQAYEVLYRVLAEGHGYVEVQRLTPEVMAK